MRLRTTTARPAALVAAGPTTVTLPTTRASADTTKYTDDFNGDGYHDLAASVLPTAP
ncbi:hypothetical protein ACFZBE_16085 [Streptomyces sp. NPDC008061]|uniref:hypothetical protein n=1 Tax=Streptomyces sp. NPDC008061 TaxID=3364805 RepID=UPI0036EC5CD1